MSLHATLRLFNGVHIDSVSTAKLPAETIETGIENGYALDPAITPTDKIITTIQKIIGISARKANASFHKSWKKVRDTDMDQLVREQLVHYLTTYGYDSKGKYSDNTIYIPREQLSLPELKEDISLVFVKAMTTEDLKNAVLSLASGVALSKEVVRDIAAIINKHLLDTDVLSNIGNREVACHLYDATQRPTDPVEYLRYMIFKLTGSTLVIKNERIITEIKESTGVDDLIDEAPADMGSIFYRYKPLFLAMKSVASNKAYFNKLRKNAVKMHKPLPVDYLNTITSQLSNGDLDIELLQEKLEGASTFRKIRLAKALNYRTCSPKSITYTVRNGRGWATEFEWNDDHTLTDALDVTLDSISNQLRSDVEDKDVYIPRGVNYALPATEKQFTGNFPSGSYIDIPEDMIVGIHWTNIGSDWIDIDLSLSNSSGKIGWDGGHRNERGSILFSGDNTSAPEPHGASELFYVSKAISEPMLLIANYYNYREDIPVPIRLMVAHEKLIQ